MRPGWSKALNSVLFFVFFLILGSLLVNVAHSQAKKRTVVLTDHLPPLEDFLEDAGLSSYYDSFLKHGFDEMQYVMRMTDKEMRIMELEKDEMAKLKSLIAGLKIEEELEIQVADPLMELRNKQEYGRMYVNRFVQSFEFLTAYFGAPMPTFSGTLAISDPWDGCAPQVRPHVAAPGRGEGEGEGGQEGAGGVFLLVGRGNCSFLEKMGNLSASPGPLPAALLLVAPNETVVRPATGHMPGPRHQQEEDTGIHVPEEVAVAMLKGSAYAPLVNAIQEDNEGEGGAGVGARLVPLQCRAGRAECLPVLEGERALPPQVDAGRISLLPPGEGDATGAPFIEFMSSTFGGRLPRGALPAALAPGDGRLCAPPPPPAAAAAAAAAAASPPAAAPLAGRAVVVERGGCSFGDKAWYAQNASARAVIIVDTTDQPLQNVAAAEEQARGLHVPAALVSRAGGAALRRHLLRGGRADDSGGGGGGGGGRVAFAPDNSVAYRWMELSMAEWPVEKTQQRILYYKLLEENEDSEERMEWITNKYNELKQEQAQTSHEEL